MNADAILTQIITKHFNENLHGSGIDSGWEDQMSTKNYLVISSSFHCMNENGYYDGWQDFYIKIDKKDITEFKLHFTGYRSKYIDSLRDYLEDMVSFELVEFSNSITG